MIIDAFISFSALHIYDLSYIHLDQFSVADDGYRRP